MKLFARKRNETEQYHILVEEDGRRIAHAASRRVAEAYAELYQRVADLNTEAEQTALAAVAMHRRQQETIGKLRAENKALWTDLGAAQHSIRSHSASLASRYARIKQLEIDLGTARDRIRQLEKDLAAERINGEDLRAKQRRAVEHLRVCERAQQAEMEDLAKRVSNR